MTLIVKVDREEMILYDIISNPTLFIEFVNNFDHIEKDQPFNLDYYQKEFVSDFNNYVCLSCARAIGKTLALSNLLIWVLIFRLFPNEYCSYHVPSKSTLDPVWSNLIRMFRSNTFLKRFIASNSGINSSEFKIQLLNNQTLLCRIAGQSGGGANVIGLHNSFSIVDEAGYYNYGTFIELQPTINSFNEGYRLIVSGVPTGLRERNVLYHCDQENSNYSKHRISAYQNSRFSEKDLQFAIEQYGGEDSDDFTHMVKGQHGKPVFALFDRSLMEFVDNPVYKLVLDGIYLADNLADYVTKLDIFPSLPNKNSKCIIGVDLGYTEPTAIVILYLDEYGRLKFHGRIQFNKVSYPIQEKLIDRLDSKFEPIIIGIDKGSAGISVIQRLQEDREFIHKNYAKRLFPVDFSSWLVLGIDTSGTEIKSKCKPFATSVLQDYANNHKLVFSHRDLEFVTELERMTYSKTPTGDIVYKTLTLRGGKRGEDHFTSALLCGVLAYYLTNEFSLGNSDRKKLFRPTWLAV